MKLIKHQRIFAKLRDVYKRQVCIKQVPDTKGGVKFNPDGTLDRAAMLTIMNPDDKAGLEAALRLKDQYGAEVTVLTMGCLLYTSGFYIWNNGVGHIYKF